VKSKCRHEHRAAVAVITGIVDVLQSKRRIDPTPQVSGVIGLDNVFPAVVETPVSEKKPRAAQREVFLMVA
jgi:hypothetical protein